MARKYLRLGHITLSAGLIASLALAPLAAVPAQAVETPVAQNAAEKELNILTSNDFHGRIDQNTVKFAGTIEQLKAASPPGATTYVGAGDLISGSLYASSVQDDQPTIDVLNALDLKTSAVGNHEFDKGYDDLVNRVQQRNGTPNADWDYLGANVYRKGTQTPALPEYSLFTLNGEKVAVIGAVTKDTPTLVSPAGVADLDFGDPVEAVNRVAAKLKAENLADVIVATFHEGAPRGVKEGGTLAQEVAAGGAFANIVNNTSPAVSAIITGHTHQEYAWDAPMPGQPGVTRPILQNGSYGTNIGQIQLFIDPETKAVTRYEVKNNPRTTTSDAELVAIYPAVAQVQKIVDDAIAYAEQEGGKPLGRITADITTAFSSGKRDNRGAESTLGNLVADSLRTTLSEPGRGGAEIGVMNSGGLRSELMYQNPGREDGVVTVASANAVLPFANNLWTTTLTGAQLKTMLEQQWQTDAQGTPITTRPYLALGVSKNVSFTYDTERPIGDRITSIVVNGAPVDPQRGYRVGTFSFLLTGGDNFRVFKEGTDPHDSGLVDRTGWFEYIQQNSPLSPDFGRRGVSISGAPASVIAGQQVTVTVKDADLASLGTPASTEVSVRYDPSGVGGGQGWFLPSAVMPSELGTFPVNDGDATLNFTVPAQLNGGRFVITTNGGTSARLPIEIPVTAPVTDGGDQNGDSSDQDGQGGGQNGSAGTDQQGTTGSGDELAVTGTNLMPLGLGILAFLAAGATAVAMSRKRPSRL